MTNEKIALLTTLEKMHDEIYDECQKCAYNSPKEYRRCCGRILNASMTLYADALTAIQNDAKSGSKTKLPVSVLIELQQKVLLVLQEQESIINKEKIMQEYFVKQNIIPKKYFKESAKINELLPTA